MNREEIIKIFGLGENATDDEIMTALKAGAQAIDDLAAERARAEEADSKAQAAEGEAKDTKAALDNEKKAHEATKAALANEKAVRADAALAAAVKDGRIGEGAKETWKTRLVNEGETAYTALANEKPLSGKDRTKGLANSCGGGGSDHEKRLAMVNEIMAGEKVPYDEAWSRAEKRDPALFGK